MHILSRHNVNLGRAEFHGLADHLWSPAGDSAVREFEAEFAAYLGVRHAVATGTGRTALYLALESMNLPAGSRVAVPEYAFYSVVAVVRALEFAPVFVAVDPTTFAVDPRRLSPELMDDLAALIVIQPFGQAASMDELSAACERHAVELVEDPSQSIGAEYGGRRLGSLGRAAAFSLVAGKNMTACGGGMMVTDSDSMAQRGRAILARAPRPAAPWAKVRSTVAQWVMSSRYGFPATLYLPFRAINRIGPGRMDGMFEEEEVEFVPGRDSSALHPVQAAIGRAQLRRLDGLNAVRRRNAEVLLAELADTPELQLPRMVEGCVPTFNAVAVRFRRAPALRRALLREGIDTRDDYMRWYDGGPRKRDDVLYLPNHPGLDSADMRHVAATVRRVIGRLPPR